MIGLAAILDVGERGKRKVSFERFWGMRARGSENKNNGEGGPAEAPPGSERWREEANLLN